MQSQSSLVCMYASKVSRGRDDFVGFQSLRRVPVLQHVNDVARMSFQTRALFDSTRAHSEQTR